MRRALAILKYIPAVLCGLLVVAWVVSLFIELCIYVPWADRVLKVAIRFGNVTIWDTFLSEGWGVGMAYHAPSELRDFVGKLTCEYSEGNITPSGMELFWDINLWIPLCLFVTALFPFAICLLTRFPLWSYFAWTALLAAELAYYLR